MNDKLSNFMPGMGHRHSESDSGWDGLYRPDRNNFAPTSGLRVRLTGKGAPWCGAAS